MIPLFSHEIQGIGQNDRSWLSRYIYRNLMKNKYFIFLSKMICAKENIRKCKGHYQTVKNKLNILKNLRLSVKLHASSVLVLRY